MKIITISREFGSGGRELGKRLADLLGFDYYDREIITAIAGACGLDENYVEKAMETHAWQQVPLTYGAAFGFQAPQMELLVEQKKVIDGIAKAGRDCVIVGRDADILLAKYAPLTLFVCADTNAKVRRCAERAAKGEELTRKAMEQKMRQIDKARARSREMLSDSRWGQADSYHLTINTSGWQIKELTPAVANFAQRWFARTAP